MESGDQRQIPENSGDQQAGTNQGAVPKSYECNFCKRGFSNAQALGGHMNIHRKDKAKLKQVSSSTNIVETKPPQPPQQIVPFEIPKIPAPSYSPILPKTNPTINSLETLNKLHGDHVSTATTERGSSWQANWHLNDKEGLCDISQSNHAVQVQVYHLPLFSQAPSDQDHQNLGQQQVPLEQQQRQQVQGDRREEGSELDLELRLGPEPQDSSSTSAKATTRKFF